MAVYTNEEIAKRNPPAGRKSHLPIVEEKDRERILNTYSKEAMQDVYSKITDIGWDLTQVAYDRKISIGEAKDMYEGYKKWKYIGYSKEPIVFIPPWNDIIHLVDEKKLPRDEQLRRMRARIIRMKRSPTPEIAKNIATILTAVDDVQDFCTTVGVGARLLERATKTPQIISKGSFTTGELLNSMNLTNKIPFEKLSPSQIKNMFRKKEIDLDKLTPSQLTGLKNELTKIHPDWTDIPIDKQKAFMKDHYKMTRERWGMSLKAKKRMAEDGYSKGTPWGKLKTQVNRRLLRTLPTTGEMLEIAQTSDMVAGVGISLGPIVGLVMDVVFGIIEDAPIKMARQTISKKELDAIKQVGMGIIELPINTIHTLAYLGNLMTKTSYMIGAGEDLGIDDTLKATWASAQAYVSLRGKTFWHAATNIWEETKGWVWGPAPNTSQLVKEALILEGIDPNRVESFPGVKLGHKARTSEIAAAYLEKSQQVVKHFEAELSKDIQGDFFASCLSTIAFDTCCATCEEGGVIEETFADELRIYTRACDYGLEPPVYSTDEEFAAWHAYIMGYVQYFNQEGPEYKLLHEARWKFWPPEELLE